MEYKNEPLMLIGSSLGGYYAQYLAANLDIVTKVVLINPALQAQKTLHPYIGQQTNMVTGESFVFTQQDFDKLQLFDVSIEDISVPTLVLLDEDDELIDCRFAEQKYQVVGRVVVYPGGSHWFDHLEEAIPEIVNFYLI